MSDDEAGQAGVDHRKWYFRVDNGKANLTPPVDKAEWFKFVSVALANGDNVGVPTSWRFPNAFDDITAAHLRAAQKTVAAGGPWRENQQASDWVGKPIAKVLKLNPDKKADKKKVCTLLKAWIENGAFVLVSSKNPQAARQPDLCGGRPMGGLTLHTLHTPRVCTGCAAVHRGTAHPPPPIGGVGGVLCSPGVCTPQDFVGCATCSARPRPVRSSWSACERACVAPYRALKKRIKVLKRRFGLKATNIKLQQKEKTNDRTLRKCDQ